MQERWWQNERLWSSLAAGIVLGIITAAFLYYLGWPTGTRIRAGVAAFAFGALLEWLRMDRKGAAVIVLVLGVSGVALLLGVRTWTPSVEPQPLITPGTGADGTAPETRPTAASGRAEPGTPQTPSDPASSGSGSPSGSAANDTASAPANGHGSDNPESGVAPEAPRALSDWLRADGTSVLYRYAAYLEDACPGRPVATGNFDDGWTTGAPARCVNSEWLAVDLGELLSSGRVERGKTYCLVFRDASGRTGQHVARGAPGLDAILIPAAHAPSAGPQLGFRVVRGLLGSRVEFTAGGAEANPC